MVAEKSELDAFSLETTFEGQSSIPCMGISGQFAKYDKREVSFDRGLWTKRALIVSSCVLAILLFDYLRVSRAATRPPEVQKLFEAERFIRHSSRLIIEDAIDNGASSLTIVDSMVVQSDENWLKEGFHRYIPATLTTGAGASVALPEPQVLSALMNSAPLEQFSVRSLPGWRGIRIGADGWRLPKGTNTFQIVSRTAEVPLFAAAGGGMLEIPLIAPSLLLKDTVEVSVVLPRYVSRDAVKFAAWIGAVNQKAEVLPLKEELTGEVTSEVVTDGRPEQLVVKFAAPRRLDTFEGVWVRVAW